MPPFTRSLFLKVVISIIVLVLTSMGGVWYAAMRAMSERVTSVAEQRARYELAEIHGRIVDAMLLESSGHDGVQGAIDRIRGNPDVDAVRILSPTGRVLYASNRAEVGLAMPTHLLAAPASTNGENGWPILAAGRDWMHAASPIVNERRCAGCHADDQDVLGVADVDISLSRQSDGVRTWGAIASLTAAAEIGIIAIGISLILGYVVVKPVRRLSMSMRLVQHGSLDVSAVPPGTTEIDGLVEGFNDMVARLRRARQVEEDAQRQHLARVEQLAALGEMAASLAHEIRNPLSGTKAAVDVLASEEPEEERRRILRHVSEELARVDGVVRELVNFAKPRAPKLAEVDLRTLVDSAARLSGPRATEQGATLEVQRAAEPQRVLADADMVQQVILNLLINALQASERHASAAVVLSTSRRDGHIACTVRDAGPGVPADRAETIFRPFMTTKARGTGLGLATSRRLIELQGGRLWLENPGEPGACFTFTLPAAGESQRADA